MTFCTTQRTYLIFICLWCSNITSCFSINNYRPGFSLCKGKRMKSGFTLASRNSASARQAVDRVSSGHQHWWTERQMEWRSPANKRNGWMHLTTSQIQQDTSTTTNRYSIRSYSYFFSNYLLSNVIAVNFYECDSAFLWSLLLNSSLQPLYRFYFCYFSNLI